MVTANVTRYATAYAPETCVIPTDPTRTEPDRPYCNYKWSPSTTSSSYVMPEPANVVVEQ
jgi:hypothetical protein